MTDWMIHLEETACRRKYHGWILYAADDCGVNSHYIDLYRKACRQYGMSIAFGVCMQGRRDLSAYSPLAEIVRSEKPSYVINRTRDYRLAEILEEWGIRVFNDSKLTELGNDKAKAYRYMEQRAVPIMPTVYHVNEEPPWYPAVIKSCAGHGGSEVYLIRDSEEYNRWWNHVRGNGCRSVEKQDCIDVEKNMQEYIMQQASSDLGSDVRVYIVGNRITSSVLRTSKTDFRSNYCLGGHIELYELSLEEQELVMKAVEGLSIGMAGIDFIFHHGRMIFNEIEDAVGARGLYALTDYDIVNDFVGCIHTQLRTLCSKDMICKW